MVGFDLIMSGMYNYYMPNATMLSSSSQTDISNVIFTELASSDTTHRTTTEISVNPRLRTYGTLNNQEVCTPTVPITELRIHVYNTFLCHRVSSNS